MGLLQKVKKTTKYHSLNLKCAAYEPNKNPKHYIDCCYYTNCNLNTQGPIHRVPFEGHHHTGKVVQDEWQHDDGDGYGLHLSEFSKLTTSCKEDAFMFNSQAPSRLLMQTPLSVMS